MLFLTVEPNRWFGDLGDVTNGLPTPRLPVQGTVSHQSSRVALVQLGDAVDNSWQHITAH